MRKSNRAIAPTLTSVPAPTPTPAPPLNPVVELRLSPKDLWFVATALVQTAWTGGEERVLALRNIHKTLRLDKINLNVLPSKQPAKPIEVIKLPFQQVDLIIRTMCGEGMGDRGFGGIAGPMMSDLAARLRETVNAAIKAAMPAVVPIK